MRENTVSSRRGRGILRLCACLLLIACLPLWRAAGAVTLKLYFADEGSDQFRREHPEVSFRSINLSDDGQSTALYYRNTYELNAAMVTQSFEADVFKLDNMTYDWNALADKGFCADLSGSAVIRDHVGRMHPAIRAQLMRGGRILGVPASIQFDFLLTDEAGWAEAGYTADDVPRSFPQLLDFLEGWARRQETDPLPGIGVISSWDEALYGPTSYIDWLSRLLLGSYVMQRQHAGQPLTFDDPLLPELLERISQVGAALYRVEPGVTGPGRLLTAWGPGFMWPDRAGQRLLSPRLRESEPELLPCTMSILSVYGGSGQKDLAVQLLEDFLTRRRWFIPLYPEYFYTDGQPVRNADYADSQAHWTRKIEETRARLADPGISAGDRNEAQTLLARFEGYLKDGREYDLSPEQLSEYKALAAGLSFPMASPFVPWTETGQSFETLRNRYVAGQLSAQGFADELKRMARMVALEEGGG